MVEQKAELSVEIVLTKQIYAFLFVRFIEPDFMGCINEAHVEILRMIDNDTQGQKRFYLIMV